MRSPQFEPYAHRGLSLDHPENTLEAFAAAAETGVRWIETDVRASRDGLVVVFHDATLNRVAGRSGLVSGLSGSELQSLPLSGGTRVPSLREVLERFHHLHFNIDIKDEGSAEHLPAVIAACRAAGRVRVASFSHRRRRRAVRRLRRLLPGQTISSGASQLDMYVFYTIAHTFPFLWPCAARVLRCVSADFDSMQIPRRYRILGVDLPVLTGRLLRVAHRFGLTVQVWTIDDPHEMRELLEMGVDGIVSNRVDLLREILS